MYYLTILMGVILGLTLFLFLFIIAKKTGLYYLPPLITFLTSIGIIIYSLAIGDIGKVDYGLLGIGFLIAAVICALLLPAILRTTEKRPWTKGDISGLIFLPCIIVVSVVIFTYVNEDYWIVEKKGIPFTGNNDNNATNEYYVSTNAYGKKMIHLVLNSKEFVGKKISVDHVFQQDSTVVIL